MTVLPNSIARAYACLLGVPERLVGRSQLWHFRTWQHLNALGDVGFVQDLTTASFLSNEDLESVE